LEGHEICFNNLTGISLNCLKGKGLNKYYTINHLYSYTQSDPVGLTDPKGLSLTCKVACEVACTATCMILAKQSHWTCLAICAPTCIVFCSDDLSDDEPDDVQDFLDNYDPSDEPWCG